MTTEDWADVWRVLALSQAAFTIGVSLVIVVVHLRVISLVPRRWQVLLPVHIAGITLAHALLTTFASVEIYQRLGGPSTWRTPYLIAALTVSDLALLSVLSFMRKRLAPEEASPP